MNRVFYSLALLITPHAHADSGSPPIQIDNPLGAGSNFETLLEKVITAILSIAGPVAVIMILVGAFQIMTANGNEEGVTNGKNTIKYALVGFVIILSAKVAVSIIKSILV